MLTLGWVSPHATHGRAPITGSASPALLAVVLAFPVAMALATGTGAPATVDRATRPARRSRPPALRARHARLDDRDRRRVDASDSPRLQSTCTSASHRSNSTQIADLAPHRLQGEVACTLSSSFRAACCCSPLQAPPSRRGRGCSRRWREVVPAVQPGLLPPADSPRTNRHHTPVAAVVVYAFDRSGDYPGRRRTRAGARHSSMRSPCSSASSPGCCDGGAPRAAPAATDC